MAIKPSSSQGWNEPLLGPLSMAHSPETWALAWRIHENEKDGRTREELSSLRF